MLPKSTTTTTAGINKHKSITKSLWLPVTLLSLMFFFIQTYELGANTLMRRPNLQNHERSIPAFQTDPPNILKPQTAARIPHKILPKILPTLLPTDKIFNSNKWGNPFVISEYKLVFFTVPKVSCTNWKLLFRRMEGQPDWNITLHGKLMNLHRPSTNNLTVLYDLPIDKAQHVLTSPEWTRAVFVREPKERVLSAFLNKFVDDYYFTYRCCDERPEEIQEECKRARNNKNFTYFLERTRDCNNEHWDPQFEAIDTKWWGMIDFVGYMDTFAEDSKRLLRSITSSKDGESAWERFGKTGWGTNGNNSFVRNDVAMHTTNAGDKLRQYYTRGDEKFVERYWGGEWNHSVYHFVPFYLFNDSMT